MSDDETYDDDYDADEIPPLSPPERCHQFRHELNNFLCSRSEEWDLNRYELMGIMLSEMFSQLAEDNDDDEGRSEEDEGEDEDNEDDEDDEATD